MKKFLKENIKEIIFLICMILIATIEFPYYIEAPGGAINITKRTEQHYNKKNGNLNILYVREYKANIVTIALSKIFKSWDLNKISNQQISNENQAEIVLRYRIMLDNSISTAIYAAYNCAGKDIKITDTKNYVIAKVKDNDIKIGDIILAIDDTKVIDNSTIHNYLSQLKENDTVNVLIERNGRTKTIPITLDSDKILGTITITNYEYDTEEDIIIPFKNAEGGSSGGMILSLSIYSQITGVDLLKELI